ncbi:MAG TPA: putative zinc-binding metallopeptidase [Acidimicrobiales bacterium]
MRAFACGHCGQLVFFDNTACLRCGTGLGFVPDRGRLVMVGADDGLRRCANAAVVGCNWMIPDDDPSELCASCRLTGTRPNDREPVAQPAWEKAESAKRQLVFQLLELHLPTPGREEDPEGGLAFDLLSSGRGPVTTGHEDGVITVDLAESDDAHRERTRTRLGEAYRTMLGHFRHEIGHFYWPRLVEADGGDLDRARALFGDERADYGEAMQHHYDEGAPATWEESFVSAYATMHPWEDWAESFAHYLHIRDTLQTAASFGMLVTGPVTDPPAQPDVFLVAAPSADLDDESFELIIGEWLPLTYALNAVNRSMGKDDLYPFVLPAPVIEKLAFVHERIRSVGSSPLRSR